MQNVEPFPIPTDRLPASPNTEPLEVCSGMKPLWRPIVELTGPGVHLNDRYSTDVLLCAPELVDADCNPQGIAPGYWQDERGGDGCDEDGGGWVGAGFDMQSDLWVDRECSPTHFLVMEGPA